MDTRMRNEEATGELLIGSKEEKGKTSTKLIALAAALVAIVAIIAGLFIHNNVKYNMQVDLAAKYFEEGNYEQAEIEFAAAVAMSPRKAKAREGLAYTKAVNGKYDKAREDYEALYRETKDEKYKKAMDEVDRNIVPTDPELRPARRRDAPNGEAPAAESTSNTAAGGKTILIDGKLYYVVTNEEIYNEYEDSEDVDWSGGSTIYVSNPDGSNPQVFRSLEDYGVCALFYKDGMLYVLSYVHEDAFLRNYKLRWIDASTGESKGEVILGDLGDAGSFYIEDGHLVFRFMTEGTLDGVVSMDLSTKERITLSEGDSEEQVDFITTDTVCADGWVYVVICEAYAEDSRGRVRLVRTRPDGSEREVIYEETCGNGGSFSSPDLSIYDGKLYMLFNYSEIDDDYEVVADDTRIRVFDRNTKELVRKEEKPTQDKVYFSFVNVDGKTFYCLVPRDKGERTDLEVFDLGTGSGTRLATIDDGYCLGIYQYDGRIYVECMVYASDGGRYVNEFRVFDANGNYITKLTGFA